MAEELLNALAKIDDLKVAARTSAFSFKGKNAPVSEIGKALGVKTVLEDSVRKSSNRLRISVQLVNAEDGHHLWSERYDREMKDIFEAQDEITLAVVEALKLKLFGDEKVAVLKRYTDNTEAYELYLKGRYQYHKYTPEGFLKAVEFLEKAIALDPELAPVASGADGTLAGSRRNTGPNAPVEKNSRLLARFTSPVSIWGWARMTRHSSGSRDLLKNGRLIWDCSLPISDSESNVRAKEASAPTRVTRISSGASVCRRVGHHLSLERQL